MTANNGLDYIEECVRTLYKARYAHIEAQAGCVLWAEATRQVLREQLGIQSFLQAGTANWPIIPDDLDDGVCCTHFGYVFEKDVAFQRFNQGLLPELHAWVVVPEHEEIIDLTTGYQPLQCKRMIGKEFHPRVLPPSYLWCKWNNLPDGWRYRADPIATAMASLLIQKERTEREALCQ
jgi:hypothetical protein